MTHRLPLLIASCPGRSVAAMKAEVTRAARAGADVAEIRIDRLPAIEQSGVGELFPAEIPLLATLRSHSEGGEGPDAFADRRTLLESVARLPFRFLDLERARDGPLLASSSSNPRPEQSIIVSSHLPEAASTAEVRRLLELPRPAAGIAKVVLPCPFERLWSDLLPNLSPLEVYDPFVLHTTGPTGPLLRAWAARLGMFAVYGSLPRDPISGAIEAVEAAQILVPELREFYRGGPGALLFAVVGHPVTHSLSPALHAFWLQRENRNGLYMAMDLATAEEFAESVAPLASGGFRGLNVTHPWKQVALSLASRAGPAAEAAGCANTLTFEPDTISAENTDVAAVRRRLTELQNAGTWDGSPVTVLGGGGAARAALAALTSVNSSAVVVVRRPEVAESLVREFGGRVGVGPSLQPTRVVIHATPAGREGATPLELPWTQVLGPSTHVVDFVYAPTDPFLRKGAEARGATYEDGSKLLVYQAAESYAVWWGSPPSPELQAAALQEVMCAA